MYLRYAVVGSCFVGAIILLVISAHSYGGKDECRNWSARSVTSLFTPCVAKTEVNELFNIGTPLLKEQDGQTKR
jgi:hypothetical protein